MRPSNWIGKMLIAAALATPALFADDFHGDYRRFDAMQADMARDQARLNEDLRCGRREAAERDAADLRRDQRAYDLRRDEVRRESVRRDDGRRDRRDWR